MDERKNTGSLDETKGRVRSAYGELTGDPSQKSKGSVEKTEGKAKRFVDRASERVKHVFDRGGKKY